MKNKESGQILVLMSLLVTTLIVLLGMVVSVGHLVQSKINLQNSVDLAAMSGASWQARFENALGLVNFRMRQNYKWLLFDVYVTQSRFNGSFKDEVDGGGGGYVSRPENVFAICQQSFGYQPVPSIGESGRGTNDTTDMCKNALDGGTYIPPIRPSAAPAYNPIYIAINETIRRLGDEARAICGESAGQNSAYLRWTSDRVASMNNHQLSEWNKVHGAFQAAFSRGAMGSLVGGSLADDTMQLTFRGNLLNSNAGAELRWINEAVNRVPPNYPQGFELHKARLFMNYVNFEVDGGGGCLVKIEQLEGAETPSGISRRVREELKYGTGTVVPEYPVNIALYSRVRPNILFWPGGSSYSPLMVAVGAAKPFGSRVGPPKEYFEREVNNGQASLINMNFFPNDLGRGGFKGMGSIDVLQEALSLLPARFSGRNELRPTESFAMLANAPTVYEALYYNVFAETSAGPYGDMYPGDTLGLAGNVLTSGAYDMPDRFSGNPGMHENIIFSRLPGFYATNTRQVVSSWGRGGSGRQGYQIKLMSLESVCRELENVSKLPAEGSPLAAYCKDKSNNPQYIYH